MTAGPGLRPVGICIGNVRRMAGCCRRLGLHIIAVLIADWKTILAYRTQQLSEDVDPPLHVRLHLAQLLGCHAELLNCTKSTIRLIKHQFRRSVRATPEDQWNAWPLELPESIANINGRHIPSIIAFFVDQFELVECSIALEGIHGASAALPPVVLHAASVSTYLFRLSRDRLPTRPGGTL